MKRGQLEHLLRAASAITDEREFLVIGSQAILGAHPQAPDELTLSVEADLVALNHPEKWNEIDAVLGELSSFHETFGYYAQGVEIGTAILPAGWRRRVVTVSNDNTHGATGYCLDPHDLVLSKYAANRPKDREFIRACFRHGIVRTEILRERLDELPLSTERKATLIEQIESDRSA